jgi:Domain of unknown function (DUF4386)
MPMSSTRQRKLALIAGVFWIITFLASIPALLLYAPVLNHAHYVLGAGTDTRIAVGALLEVILAIAGIGTAVTMFPILKRQNESLALGFVASRVLESTVIVIGLISVLAVVTLRKDFAGAAGAGTASLLVAGKSLVAIHKWTFLLGPGVCAGLGNGLLLGYLMYRSELVPRRMALLGLIGGPLLLASDIAVLFGAYNQTSRAAGILTVPEFAWELSLGIYLIVKGFKTSSPVLDTRPTAAKPASLAAPAVATP